MSNDEIYSAKKRICDAAYELGLALDMNGSDGDLVKAAVYQIAQDANGGGMTDMDVMKWSRYAQLLGVRSTTLSLAAAGDLSFTIEPNGEPRYYAAH